MEPQNIKVVKAPAKRPITFVYHVIDKITNDKLGCIAWAACQYCFFHDRYRGGPALTAEQLKDIAWFCEDFTEKHYKEEKELK